MIILSFLLLLIFIRSCWIKYKENPDIIKSVYLSNHKDWIFSIFLLLFVFSSMSLLYFADINWIKWSIINLFDSNQVGSNLIIAPIWSTNSLIISTVIWILLVFFIPYGAYIEEEIFRKGKISIKSRIFSSISFGFLHMLVGVPVFTSIVLSIVGWFFSLRYINALKKSDETSALISSTSLHAKYNFIIVTLLYLTLILSSFIK
jgi:hypothetical protein